MIECNWFATTPRAMADYRPVARSNRLYYLKPDMRVRGRTERLFVLQKDREYFDLPESLIRRVKQLKVQS